MKERVAVITLLGLFVAALAAPAGFAGVLKGKISAQNGGPPPKVNVTKDKNVCGASGELVKESKLISASGGLKNAVVIVEGAGGAKPGAGVITQKNCRFEPHAQVIAAGSALEVRNEDGITHNFHSYGFENDPLNFSQPGDMKVKKIKGDSFEFPEVIQIRCDIHEWMEGWVVVTESGAAAVTDGEGNFSISGIEPGSYKVKVWHEAFGEVVKDVKIGGETEFNLTMKK